MNIEDKPKLSVGKYTIDLDSGGCKIYSLGEGGHKSFICGEIPDPQIAMQIIEGLIMVEYKRFYYPESSPTFEQKEEKPQENEIPFLKNIVKGDLF